MTDSANVTNGTANITINTSTYDVGKYKIKASYPQSNGYNASSGTAILTLNELPWVLTCNVIYVNSYSGYVMSFEFTKGQETINMGSIQNSLVLTFEDGTTRNISLYQSSNQVLNRILNYQNVNSYFEQAVSGTINYSNLVIGFDPHIFSNAYNELLQSES